MKKKKSKQIFLKIVRKLMKPDEIWMNLDFQNIDADFRFIVKIF